MNLEHELREALKRKSPSPGFEDAVLRKCASAAPAPPPRPQARLARVALPLAASLVIASAAGVYVHRHQQRQEQAQTEKAARDVARALQLASEKVSAVQVRVQEISQP